MSQKPTAMTTQERSWVLYDVGNSAFVLVMVTAIMPIFFKDFAAADMDGAISTARWGFANATASLILALLAPILGVMADQGRKKSLMLFFLIMGLLLTLALILVQQGQWLLCLLLFVLARVGWSGANVFYDAFITDVTSPDRMDMISTKGYGWGYIGSVIPFVVIIVLLLFAGMGDGLPIGAVKLGFGLVALWWLLFSLPLMRNVQQRRVEGSKRAGLRSAMRQLLTTMANIKQHRQVFLFLAAYFFYIDGVGTMISMSTVYGRDLGFGIVLLIAVLLFIQVVAFPFALLYGRLAQRFSTRLMLMVGIGMFSLVCLIGFLLPAITSITIKTGLFWGVAFLVASSMGGIQALSRSYFAQLIPAEKSAEFFGFYNVFGKFAAITGPFLMGIVTQLTGDSRWGVLSILILFIIGGVLLTRVEQQPSKAA